MSKVALERFQQGEEVEALAEFDRLPLLPKPQAATKIRYLNV